MELADFAKSCINFPPSEVINLVVKKALNAQVKIESAETEKDGHKAIPLILNLIEKILFKESAYDSQLLFTSSPKQPPLYHPLSHRDIPDFHALPLALHEKLSTMNAKHAWHHLVSVGEWKPGMSLSASEQSQAAGYAASHNQARPDRPGVLVFSACRGGYVLGYSDPSIWTTTEKIGWGNLTPLIGYVHSLHIPRLNFRDPTITLSPRAVAGPPQWMIRDESLNIDATFKMIYIGRAHSRMTTVFQQADSDATPNVGPLIIKDSYLNSSRGPERELFKVLVDNDASPGWVTIRPPPDDVAIEPLLTPLVNNWTSIRRRKDRTVMENSGTAFSKCKTLSEAISAVYDILEADRWAITQRRILHRDVSPGNILIQPVKDSPPCAGVCFIGGVFTGKPEQASSAILLDLDNGTRLPEAPLSPSLHDIVTGSGTAEEANIRALSGTPMYIARAPSKGLYGSIRYPFPPLPALPDSVHKLYIKAYPDDAFRGAQGPVGSTSTTLFDEFSGKRVIQRSWHDAESAALILLIFLLRCSPLEAEDEPDDKLQYMESIYKNIQNTPIGSPLDVRDLLFQSSTATWTLLLHDDLAHVANLASAICAAVLPEYEFLEPSDGVVHEVVLHEVLQRLLFGFYCTLKEDPELDVTFKSALRPIADGAGWTYTTTGIAETGSKYAGRVITRKADVNKTEVLSGPFASPFAGPSAEGAVPSGTVYNPFAGPSTVAQGARPSGHTVPSGVVGPSGYNGGPFAATIARLEEARQPYEFRHKRKEQSEHPAPPKRSKK